MKNRTFVEWIETEFDWSKDTAYRFMNAAKLATKFRKLRNLRLAKTTIYALCDVPEEELPAVIDELAKHATKKRLGAHDARRVMAIGAARHRHGDYPDATLCALDLHHASQNQELIEALKAKKPKTDEEADAIVDNYFKGKDEAAGIVPDDGPAPDGDQTADDQGGDDRTDDDQRDEDQIADDEGGDEEHGGASLPLADADLRDALNVVLHYARQGKTFACGLSGPELDEIAHFITTIHHALHSGNKAKIAADRAEARSKRQQNGAPGGAG